jgi:hypothetical protein
MNEKIGMQSFVPGGAQSLSTQTNAANKSGNNQGRIGAQGGSSHIVPLPKITGGNLKNRGAGEKGQGASANKSSKGEMSGAVQSNKSKNGNETNSEAFDIDFANGSDLDLFWENVPSDNSGAKGQSSGKANFNLINKILEEVGGQGSNANKSSKGEVSGAMQSNKSKNGNETDHEPLDINFASDAELSLFLENVPSGNSGAKGQSSDKATFDLINKILNGTIEDSEFSAKFNDYDMDLKKGMEASLESYSASCVSHNTPVNMNKEVEEIIFGSKVREYKPVPGDGNCVLYSAMVGLERNKFGRNDIDNFAKEAMGNAQTYRKIIMRGILKDQENQKNQDKLEGRKGKKISNDEIERLETTNGYVSTGGYKHLAMHFNKTIVCIEIPENSDIETTMIMICSPQGSIFYVYADAPNTPNDANCSPMLGDIITKEIATECFPGRKVKSLTTYKRFIRALAENPDVAIVAIKSNKYVGLNHCHAFRYVGKK